MLHNPDGTCHQDGDARGSDPTANRSESWWFDIKNASNSTDISNESHINLFADHIQADVNAGRTEEHQRLKKNENPVSIELIAHSAPCSSNPYTGPGYGGAWQSYATQSLGQSHLNSMLQAQMAEAPVYVNAKQYHGILRRRQSRAKAELEKKPNKVRRVMRQDLSLFIILGHCYELKKNNKVDGSRSSAIPPRVSAFAPNEKRERVRRSVFEQKILLKQPNPQGFSKMGRCTLMSSRKWKNFR